MVSLIGLVLHRLRQQGALHGTLLCGWIMAIALMAAIPMYTDAVNQHLLQNELNRTSRSRYPALGFLFLSTDTVSAATVRGGDRARLGGYQQLAPYFATDLADTLQLPVVTRMHYVRSDLFQLFPPGTGSYGRGEQPLGMMNLGFITALEAHAMLLAGSMPVPPTDTTQPVDVLVHQTWANRTGMQVGEVYILYRAINPDPTTPEKPFILPIRVSGIWNAANPDAPFWYIAPSVFENALLIAPDTYLSDLQFRIPRPLFNATWYAAFDGQAIRAEDVRRLQQNLDRAQTQIQQFLPGTRLTLSPEDALLRYQANVAAQSPVLLVLGLPVIALILLFVTLTAANLMERQQLEMTLLRSRGCSMVQILGIFGLQDLILSVLAFVLGVPVGFLAAYLIGPAASLLMGEDAHWADLILSPTITRDSLVYAGIAVLLVNVATLVPVMRLARATVVQAERRLSRPPALLSGTGLTWDLLLAVACAYGWYLLHTSGRFAWPKRFQGVEIWENPLLFLTPCLFLWIGTRLLRYLWPSILRGLELPMQALPGLVGWLAIRNLARRAPLHVPLLNLLLLTTSLGTFVASVARTLDHNLTDSALYRVGTTLVVVENAKRFAPPPDTQSVTSGGTGWVIPPFDLHQNIEGVLAAARVGRFPVSVTIDNRSFTAELLGIDRVDWPQVGFFRTDFASLSLGALMNELAMANDGLLVSTHLLEQTGYHIGDILPIRGLHPGSGSPVPFRIVGHLDYFPTVYPPEDLFLIGNLAYVHTQTGGPLPYYVWLRLAGNMPESTVQAVLEQRGIEVLEMEDARWYMAERRAHPVRLGLLGFLALGYAVTVLLSIMALAVHAVLNAHRRRIQLGLLQAMGLLPRQASGSLALEQILLTALGIGGGALLGYAASQIFVPYLQGNMTAVSRIPPYVVQISWTEVRLATGIMAMAATMITLVLMVILSRLKLFETLKMGELHG